MFNSMDASRAKVLPGAAQLEMVRAAVILAAEEQGEFTGDAGPVVRMTNVVWGEPVVVGPGQQVHVDLYPGSDGDGWAVIADSNDEAGSGGSVAVLPGATPDRVDVQRYGTPAHPDSLLVDLGETDGPADAVVVPGQFARCLAAVARDRGWGGREVALLSADEVTYAGLARYAAVRGAVEIVPSGHREATLSVDLVDERGTSLVAFRGLRVSAEEQTPAASQPQEGGSAGEAAAVAVEPGPGRRVEMAGWSVAECLEWELKDSVSQLLKLPVAKLDEDANLQDYGFDSISLVEFAGVLGERLGIELTPDVFFSHPTLTGLGAHLMDAHRAALEAFYREGQKSAPPRAASRPTSGPGPRTVPRAGQDGRSPRRRLLRMSAPARAAEPEGAEQETGSAPEPVAIVGMSGRFPGARTVDELWHILAEGDCVVGEVPGDRSPAWGGGRRMGALPGIAEFDPLFFEISGREAETMDPRQRLLLQEMWRALEDAGIGSRRLTDSRVGIFVGVEEGDFRDLVGEDAGVTANSNAILASRLAYFLNLAGPSMAINTTCSSGLVALHEACLSLRYGDCDTAIVAGANILADPRSYDAMAAAGMLSPEGVCRAFDERADGMVPGEAVAVLVLRKRRVAERDGQRIHATVLGSGVNYDGRTNGITAPSGAAQSRLLRQVYERAGISPESLEYVVTHGTGTRLGDPIEINALAEAFSSGTERREFCALTSLKPNIGHTQAASGLVGVMALAMAMRHETIPPSINCEQPSDYIRWQDSPFYVNRERRAWPQGPQPARGAVSAFGMSGTNAHVVLEAGVTARTERERLDRQPASPSYLLALSAKTSPALGEALTALADHLAGAADAGAGYLASVSHTLMSGRHHFAHRCAVVAQDLDDAVRLLRDAARGEKPRKVYQSTVTRDFTPHSLVGDLVAEAPGRRQDDQRYQELLLALADFYCQGYDLRGEGLFEETPALVALPSYPFARQRHWPAASRSRGAGTDQGPTHPLVQRNTSSLTEQRYSSVLLPADELLVGEEGDRRLPAAAHLEMAREAVHQATRENESDTAGVRLHAVRWLRPVRATGRTIDLHVAVIPERGGDIGFEIFSGDGTADPRHTTVHCQGDATRSAPAPQAPETDLEALREQARQDPALVVVRLPRTTAHDHVVLPFGALDDALLAAAASDPSIGTAAGTPAGLDSAEIFGAAPATWAVLRRTAGPGTDEHRFDIDLCEDSGRVAVRFTGLVLGPDTPAETSSTTGLLGQEWAEAALPAGAAPRDWRSREVVLCDTGAAPAAGTFAGPANITVLSTAGEDTAERYTSAAEQLFTEVRRILVSKPAHEVLLQVVVPGGADHHVYGGLSGLLKSAHRENPRLVAQLVALDEPFTRGTALPARVAALLDAEANAPEIAAEVHYAGDRRTLSRWRPLPGTPRADRSSDTLPWRADGTYLITGGAGGLGLLLAREIVRHAPGARIVLTGRSARDGRVDAALAELGGEGTGSRVSYRQADVTDQAAVTDLVNGVTAPGDGPLGILHCAGINRDAYIIRKSPDSIREVLAPKVDGLVNLDRATAALDLDFLVCFASTSGSLGNAGQADYALANAFMDHFAVHREQRVRAGDRHGRTLAVDWSLWRDGGMTIDPQAVARLEADTGLVPIPSAEGIAAFYDALDSDAPHTLCLALRDPARLAETVDRLTGAASTAPREQSPTTAIDQETVVAYLTGVMAREMKIPAGSIDADASLDQYGIDSITVLALTDVLEDDLGTLPKTLFFEYRTVTELGGYLRDSHAAELARALGVETAPAERGPAAAPVAPVVAEAAVSRRGRTRHPAQSAGGPLDVAIVGVAGRYPQAADLDVFWDNLVEGRDCVTETPAGRWDQSAFADAITCGWGGWLDGVDRFDPLFFNIAPREAEMMDPQERLFLQCAYAAIEDAGYTPRDLERGEGAQDGVRGAAGVFVGVTTADYQLLCVDQQAAGTPLATAGNFASMANRVSYHLNLHGPSLAIDTMCSSSLTAISQACESIRRGESGVAIAGGVNLALHPNKYLLLSQGQFVSPAGRCVSFGDDGEGYVPAEGVGAVLLKSLDRAVRDGDHIYGVIRGAAVNHGGRTNGYTVPNPNAQGGVIEAALRQAETDPRAVGYVEAHGTGTKLGDPIEIRGLGRAFDGVPATQPCAIGSVKSNIGHAEAASGIAGLTKILLQMRHGTLVPSLHAEVLNPFIDFEATPFRVQRTAEKWHRTVVETDGRTRELPRVAGLSSFGAGGSNAHLIVSEYLPARPVPAAPGGPAVLVLSAKTGERLRVCAERLLSALRTGRYQQGDLPSIGYTLQVGREAMPHRMGFVAAGLDEAERTLAAFLDGSGAEHGVTAGRVDAAAVRAGEPDAAPGGRREPGELVAAWVAGSAVDWRSLYRDGDAPARISLPGYPFAEESYWLPTGDGAPASSGRAGRLHPLLHENTSDLASQRFTSRLADLPSRAAQLEMARAAALRAVPGADEGTHTVRLSDVAWHEGPPAGEDGHLVHVSLRPARTGDAEWTVHVEQPGAPDGEPAADDEELITAEGTVTLVGAADRRERLDRAAAGGSVIELSVTGDPVLALVTALEECVAAESRPATAREVLFAPLGAGSPAWAVVDRRDTEQDVAVCAEDGTVLLRVRGLTWETAGAADLAPAPDGGAEVAAGPGRRVEMAGWSVAECLDRELKGAVSQLLKLPLDRVEDGVNLQDYGFDSISLVEFAGVLGERFGVELTPDVFFSHPTLDSLSSHLLDAYGDVLGAFYQEGGAAGAAAVAAAVPARRRVRRVAPVVRGPGALGVAAGVEPVGIVGMSGRFPGARTVSELWDILAEGRSVVGEVSPERSPAWGPDRPMGEMPGVAEFDPLFFEISPREAELMDPRQRLLLQEMWRALEDAGYGDPAVAGDRVGVFVGVEEGDYRFLVDESESITANATSILASRLAYFLNLSGPSMAINTSCSSGLVALHEACLSLRYGDCDTAIVAGANILSYPGSYDAMAGAGMLSPEGVLRAFDRRADGMVPGEAVAVLVLRKQVDAERDGQRVHATVLGSGVNYDGRTNGITAPSGAAQSRLLRDVYERVGVSAESV
ncbi:MULTISPECIES: SDR family NAD(P)-dependent oxidoreductase, partial [unclassified Streptomyces]|uniref:SDR family NAD(P)-dependent oxidoreductase n=1 Tax=unclassified Streptomyces TaxID=2593676 RepID=UPI0037AF9C07